ncbi:MAG: UDP-N-acetylmuramate dehydrogenase [Candidatus Paceibacterota bacterium]
MIKILENYDLTKLNTFGVSAYSNFFVEVNDETDLEEIFLSSEFKNNKKLFLGGGSNILFTKDFDGIVILNKLKGIEIIKAPTRIGVPTEVEKDFVFIRAMGGEKWHDLVSFAVDCGYWGIENLSLIPGTVGAAPIQNIGAYGVEIKDILENVEAYDIEKGYKKVFKKEECEFGYRDSIFKNKLKNKYFISAIILKLNKKTNPNISYRALKEYLDENGIEVKNSRDISNAIIAIRKSKLPDPILIGNAGSFFKNIFVDIKKIEEIKLKHKDVKFFEENGEIKIPAGWLIEKCGWKGKRIGNVGVHEKQALVLVNYGGATGKEIKDFSEQIISSVLLKFGLILEREVNLI